MTDPVPEPEPEPAAPDVPVDDTPEPAAAPEPAVEEPEPTGEPEGDPVAHPALLVSRDHLRLLKATLAPDLTDAELELFAQVANRVGLDPFAKQIYAVKRNDSASGAKRMTIQTGIDGLRLIARRTGQMAGRLGPYFCGDDGVWLIGPNDTPLPWIDTSRKPYAAMVGVLRHGDLVPTWGIAHWSEYVVTGNAGKMWEKLPTTMLAKVAEAQALRASFPAETSGLYTDDEMMQADFKTTAIEANFAEAAARLLSEADPGTFSEIARRAEAIRRTGRDVVNALGLIWQNAGLGKIPELAVGEAKRAQAAILSIEQRIGRNEWGQDVHRLWIDATAAVANGEAPTAAEDAPDGDPPPEPADAPENEPEAPIPADPEREAVARSAVAEMTAEQVADMIRMYETEPDADPAAAAEQLVGLLAADDEQR